MLSILEGLEFELVEGRKEGEIWECGVARGISLDIQEAYSQSGQKLIGSQQRPCLLLAYG